MAQAAHEQIGSRDEAERLLAAVSSLMDELTAALETETALIGAGRVRDGLAGEARKAELGQAYILKLQEAKASVLALTRFAPERLREFRAAQSVFERVLDRNQTVIATARAVSEGLMKGLAEEIERDSRPTLYGGAAGRTPVRSTPLVFSRRF